jgi:hypothetical protein
MYPAACLLLSLSLGQPQGSIQSGPAVGETLKYFHPLVVNGPYADRKVNNIGAFGAAPASLVFLRRSGGKALELVKQLDAEAVRARRFYVGAILLSEDRKPYKLAEALKKLAEKEQIQRAYLCVWNSLDGPEGYAIAKEAEVTVVVYRQKTVAATFAFRKGELDGKAIDRILQEARKVSAVK